MCSEEFKLAGEDLPFLCWGNDFLASLYNQGRINCACVRGLQRKRKGVCLFVWLRQSLSLFLLLIHRAYKSLGAAKLNLSTACVLSECIGDRCVYWWETNTLKLRKKKLSLSNISFVPNLPCGLKKGSQWLSNAILLQVETKLAPQFLHKDIVCNDQHDS